MGIKINILIFTLFASGIGFSQSEDSFKDQARDDAKSLSSKDYPYIEEFHKGVREKLQGNFEEAIKHFNNCLEIKSDDDAVYFALGGIAKSQKRLSSAQENFEQAYQLDSTNVNYLKELAFLSYDRANFEQAQTFFKKLCAHEPRNLDYRYGYASVLIYNKSYQEAIDQLNKLEEQVGVVPQIMFMKADLFKELDQTENVEKTLLSAQENYPDNQKVLKQLIQFYQDKGEDEKAIELLTQQVQKDSTNGQAILLLANHYHKAKDGQQFRKYVLMLLPLSSVNVENKIKLVESFINEYEQSTAERSELASILQANYPDNPSVLSIIAQIYTAQHAYQKALSTYRKAIASNPDDFDLWKEVLHYENKIQAYKAMYEDGQNAMTLFPSLPFVYLMAAKGALYVKSPDEAIQILAAGELYVLDNQHLQSLFEMRKGEIDFYNKAYKKGITHFEKALAIEKNDLIRINYAYGLSKAGIALKIAQEQLDKITPIAFLVKQELIKAMLTSETKGYTEGIKRLQAAVAIDEINYIAPLYDLMGDFYFKNNQLDKAETAWKKAIEFQSQNTAITKKIKELKLYDPEYD